MSKYVRILLTMEQCQDAIYAIECWLSILEDKHSETGGYVNEIKKLEHIAHRMRAAQAKSQEA